MAEPAGKPPTDDPDPFRQAAREIRRAAFALYWEAFWPRAVLTLGLAAVFLSLVWLPVLSSLPALLRLGVALVVCLAILAAFFRTLLTPWPRRDAALARLERDSGLPHRPLTALADRHAVGSDDPLSRALWTAHARRLEAALAKARASAPAPRVDKADPYALRAVAFLTVIVAVTAVPGNHLSAIADAFRLPPVTAREVRVDAWVTPPAYTGLSPRYLPVGGDTAISVQEGSLVTLRINGLADTSATFTEKGASPEPMQPKAVAVTAPDRASATGGPAAGLPTIAYEWEVVKPGRYTLTGGGSNLASIDFDVIADHPPTIRLTEQPSATGGGALHLAYETLDDYGVKTARAVLTLQRPDGARPLVALPDIQLALPPRGGAEASAATTRDLSANPLAGSIATVTLSATDDRGQTAETIPLQIRLPGRLFRNPLAAMIVDQRRRLAADAGATLSVAATLDDLGELGAPFLKDASVAIGLGVIESRLRHARDDAELVATLDFMWTMALAIENGDASAAEQKLREAREALRNALENKADPKEIARLTQELRKALDEYLSAMADELRNNPDKLKDLARQQGQSRSVTQQDLDKMLDQMQQLSELGQQDAARQLLSRLDEMLDNMRMGAEPGQKGNQDRRDKAMDELADMIRRQQDLMNETHKYTPDGRTDETLDMPPEQREQAMKDLQDRQKGLADRLQKLLDDLKEGGREPGKELGKAGEGMKQAEQGLGEGDPDQALGQQGQALDAMRKGARELAQNGEGEGEGPGGQRPGREQAGGTDPLGRPDRRKGPDFGDATRVPGEIDIQRVRRLMEELRRRYSDPDRPALELDYLRRLLSPF